MRASRVHHDAGIPRYSFSMLEDIAIQMGHHRTQLVPGDKRLNEVLCHMDPAYLKACPNLVWPRGLHSVERTL